MSGLALPRRIGSRAGRDRAGLGRLAEGEGPVSLRLATFAALAAFCAAHWVGLVAAAPAGRTVAAVGVACATGAALAGLGRLRAPRLAVHALALVVLAAGLGAGLAAMGLPVRLLGPGAWDALGSELDRGLSGIRTVTWPYSGADDQVRLVVLLGAPLLLTVSAALSFWPARRARGLLRTLGLVALLVLYATAVTEHDPGEPLLRGFLLFLLVAAWLWLPRLRGRAATVGGAVVLAVAVLTLPVASRLDAEAAIVDYRSWNWFGGDGIVFNWNHTYGPLDWPREGTTLLDVESERPLYWKAETLDEFDGLRWRRTGATELSSPYGELPDELEDDWIEDIRVTVRSLETDFVVGAGTPLEVDGAGASVSGSADGTVRRLDEPLTRGESYSVRAYVPNPSEERMEDAGSDYPSELLQYTRLELPSAGETALPGGERAVGGDAERPAVVVPFWEPAVVAAPDSTLAGSPYAQTYRLARSLTAGAPTAYAAVTRVQEHLRDGFTYSERPPPQAYPLESFLLEDRIGYCQQFSGAMALMLRMSGIPARVVSGFSPGSRNRAEGEFVVTDLDAHSWVEVFFPDVGWVTFDPTPRAAPADRAGLGPEADPLNIPNDGDATSADGDAPLGDRAGGGAGAAGPGGASSADDGVGALPAIALAVLLAAGGALLMRRSGRVSRGAPDSADAGLRELERALPRLGWALGGATTLLELEARLRRAAGPVAARYVARLRDGRYSPAGAQPPPRGERRAVRRELTARRGLRARLRGYLALPPGGPRAGRRSLGSVKPAPPHSRP